MTDLVNNGYQAEGVLSSELVMVYNDQRGSEAWEQIKSRRDWYCPVTKEKFEPALCWRPSDKGSHWQHRRISDAGMRLIFGDSPMNIFCDREAAKRGERAVQHVRDLPSNKDKP